jgi:hypothetical protein
MELATDLGEDAIEIFLVGKFAERFSLGKEKKPFGFFLSGAAHGPGSRAQAETVASRVGGLRLRKAGIKGSNLEMQLDSDDHPSPSPSQPRIQVKFNLNFK